MAPDDDLGPLGDFQYAELARHIQATCGVRLPPTKRLMCEGRLRARARARGCRSLDAYASLVLRPQGDAEELQHVIDAVTTHKTDFFREPAHFALLRDRLVPELVDRHPRKPARLKIWSAACSTGAEAFTVAMVLHDLRTMRSDFAFSILGTDISTEVLDDAGAAIYPASMAAEIPPPMRARYLMQASDPERHEVRIVPELRRTASFAQLNLVEPPYPVDDDVDVIFCRNVLIYFERATQEAVVRELASHLRPGGFLLLGHSESMTGACAERLQLVAPTVYQAGGREAKRR